ncbi:MULTISPECIES: histidine phosphatase family protein [unclassified Rhizobium]|uniref:histidine phosphatase family protein n=1 Tax=unclassified Rhizobium TaxID=2613769 RepID=UPI001ADB5F8C|nr:histidine phosphatase family protein [Rhizobium sp. L58/93]MBO9188174.1 histidine phosphatase family protein [Rhizobium sp. E27B/91]QXZ86184.1 histidine phosphatase family protein [Rhizobium sp. K1/93]QXZ92360.1 histidine phosphatase family protein [Rhizobium sp. K15/93]QYA04424.1 histidine phosphatase family protein [Rhizobium sp. B21/90]
MRERGSTGISYCPLPVTFRLAIVRHGQTRANLEGRFSGKTEVNLTPLGHKMAEAVAESPLMAHAKRIFCSPQRRAVTTAGTVARKLALPTPTAHDGLRELEFGDWEGCRPAEVQNTVAYERWKER